MGEGKEKRRLREEEGKKGEERRKRGEGKEESIAGGGEVEEKRRRGGGEEDSRPSVTPHRSAAFNYQYSCLSPPPEHPQILREILEGVFFTFFGNSFCFTGPESTIQKQTNNIVESQRKRDNIYVNGVSDGY